MEDNSTIGNHTYTTTVVFPQEAAILAAICACLFSVVGVVGMFFCASFDLFKFRKL